MIRWRLWSLVLVFAGVAVLCLQLSRSKGGPASARAHESSILSKAAQARPKTSRTTESSAPSAAIDPNDPALADSATVPARTAQPPPAPAEPVPDTPESASLPASTVLENMRTTVRQYAAAFGENPVGTNPEIASALAGQNPRQINFLKGDGNRVNANGELVDIWGTPYFFHQISGHQMEIRSAGPDRIMYTADDLIIR